MPSRKADQFTLASRDAVHEHLLSVAMTSLCNEMDFQFLHVATRLILANTITNVDFIGLVFTLTCDLICNGKVVTQRVG